SRRDPQQHTTTLFPYTTLFRSAPRSHRGGQGFKSPQLHRVLPGQAAFSSSWLPGREPSVWLGLREQRRGGTDRQYARRAESCDPGALAGDARVCEERVAQEEKSIRGLPVSVVAHQALEDLRGRRDLGFGRL